MNTPPALNRSSDLQRGLASTVSIEGPSSDGIALLFGSNLASVAEFGCTHRRIRGRLYATTEMILFYSNLLGFETRIAVLFADVLSMKLCRTTSIELHLSDGELYTFRSFQDREEVLQLLTELKESDDRTRSHSKGESLTRTVSLDSHSPVRRLHGQSSDPLELASMSVIASKGVSMPRMADDGENSSISSVATPRHSNRQRAASESNVRRGATKSPERFIDRPATQSNLDSSTSEDDTLLRDASGTSRDEDLGAEELQRLWEGALEMKHTVGADHVGVERMVLTCGLNDFIEKFLAEDAPFSMDKFQRDEIGDKDLRITPWTIEASRTSTRTMTFIHPIPNSMGMGPSEAQTTRVQRLCRYGDLGLTLENTTQVDGIPAADCFYVRDHWLVESLEGGESVRLTARFGTHFHKRTLLKSFIEKSVLSQTKAWFVTYSNMLKKALTDQAKGAMEESQAEKQTITYNEDDKLDALKHTLLRLVALVTSLCVAAVAMAVHLLLLSRTVNQLRTEITLLRDDIQSIAYYHPQAT